MVAVHELPAGQRVQLAAPPVEKVPAAQAVQEVAPAELYSPAGHAEGDADCEGHSDPAGQREHVPPAGGGGGSHLKGRASHIPVGVGTWRGNRSTWTLHALHSPQANAGIQSGSNWASLVIQVKKTQQNNQKECQHSATVLCWDGAELSHSDLSTHLVRRCSFQRRKQLE